MKAFFIFVEIMMPVFSVYIIWKKKDLSIVYLPFLFFCNDIIERSFSASLMYLLYTGVIFYYAIHNLTFIKNNIFSVLLVIYFFFLLPYSKDLVKLRPYFVFAIVLFLLIPILAEVYKKYSREHIFQELSKAAFLVLALFSVNSLFSTIFNYNPNPFYGISSGILYGALSNDHLNILPFASFIVIRKGIKDKSTVYILLYLVSIFLVMLTFRRTVMALCVLGTFIVMLELLDFRRIREFLVTGLVILIFSFIVVYFTGFLETFWERYELRNLDNRAMEREGRLLELGLLYKDLFVYYDYSPWFGYELFASSGNYGKNIFGNRSLHTDIGTIVHSSGLVGFFLYMSMVFVAFNLTWRRTYTKNDIFQFAFCVLAFWVFFISGRWYTVSATSLMYCLLYLPLGKNINQRPKSKWKLTAKAEKVSYNSW